MRLRRVGARTSSGKAAGGDAQLADPPAGSRRETADPGAAGADHGGEYQG